VKAASISCASVGMHNWGSSSSIIDPVTARQDGSFTAKPVIDMVKLERWDWEFRSRLDAIVVWSEMETIDKAIIRKYVRRDDREGGVALRTLLRTALDHACNYYYSDKILPLSLNFRSSSRETTLIIYILKILIFIVHN
jgi:hypothetical protein